MAKRKGIVDRDLGWKKISSVFKNGKRGVSCNVGIQGDNAAQSKEADGPTNADLAAIHEYGTRDKRVPERSFMRSTFDAGLAKYKQKLDAAAGIALDKAKMGEMNVLEGELLMLGEVEYRADIIKRVRGYIPPQLEKSTLARSKRARDPSLTLWDTGVLINSISAVIDNKLPISGGA